MQNHPWTELLVSMTNEIERKDMPQIKQSELPEKLTKISKQASVQKDLMDCSKLSPIQEDADKKKLQGMVNDLGDTPLKEWPPIFISEDNFIVDGHHRWLAAIYLHGDNAFIPCFRIGLPKTEALALAKRMDEVIRLTEGKRLAVFDFDNTLVKTTSKVHIRDKNTGKVIQSITPSQFEKEPLPPDQEYDFTEFTDNALRNPVTIRKIFRFFRDFAKRQTKAHKTIILTARGAHTPIKKWLKDIGLKHVYVVALDSTDPYDKARWIEKEINSGYDNVVFYDDKKENIQAVRELQKKYPRVKFKLTHVVH